MTMWRDVWDYVEFQLCRASTILCRFYRYFAPALWAFLVGNKVTIAVAVCFDNLMHLKTDEELTAWVNTVLISGLHGKPTEKSPTSSKKWSKPSLWRTKKHQSSIALQTGHHETSESEREVRKRTASSSSLLTSIHRKNKNAGHYSTDTDVEDDDRRFKGTESEGHGRSRSSTATSAGGDENASKNEVKSVSNIVGNRKRSPKIALGPVWADGRLMCRLMNALNPGTCPRPDLLDSRQPAANVVLALKLAKRYLRREPALTVEDVLKLKSTGLDAIRAKNSLRGFLLELKNEAESSSLNDSALSSSSDAEHRRGPVSNTASENDDDQRDSFAEDLEEADPEKVRQRKRSAGKGKANDEGVTKSTVGKKRRSTSEQVFSTPARHQLQRQSSSNSLHHHQHSSSQMNRYPSHIRLEGQGLKHAEQYKKAEFIVRYCGDEVPTPPPNTGPPPSAMASALISASFLADVINNNSAKLNGPGDFTKNLDLLIDVKGPPPGHDFCTERLTRRSPRKKERLVEGSEDPGEVSPSSSHPHDRPSIWRRQTVSSFSNALPDRRGHFPAPDTHDTSHLSHPRQRVSTSSVPSLSTIPYEYEILSKRVVFGYTPQSPGNHWVSIYWQGKHVTGSPFVVNVGPSGSSRKRQNSEISDPLRKDSGASAIMNLRQQWGEGGRVDLATALRRERFKSHRNAVSSLDVLELQARNNRYEYTANWVREDASSLSRIDSEEAGLDSPKDNPKPVNDTSTKQRKRNIFAESRNVLNSQSFSVDDGSPITLSNRPKPLLRQDSDESIFLRRRMAAEWSNQNLRRNSWTATHQLGHHEASTLLSASSRLLTPLRGKRVLRRTAILGQDHIELDPRQGDVDPAELAAMLVRQLSYSKSTSTPTDIEDDLDDDLKEDEDFDDDDHDDEEENDTDEERRQFLHQLDRQKSVSETTPSRMPTLRDELMSMEQHKDSTTSADEDIVSDIVRSVTESKNAIDENRVQEKSLQKRHSTSKVRRKLGDISRHTTVSLEELTDRFDVDEAPLSILPSGGMMHRRCIPADVEGEPLDTVEETVDIVTDAAAGKKVPAETAHEMTAPIMQAVTEDDTHTPAVASLHHDPNAIINTLEDDQVDVSDVEGAVAETKLLSDDEKEDQVAETLNLEAEAISPEESIVTKDPLLRTASFKRRLTRQKALDPASSGDEGTARHDDCRRIDTTSSSVVSEQEKVSPSVKSLSSKFESLLSSRKLTLERSSSVKSIGIVSRRPTGSNLEDFDERRKMKAASSDPEITPAEKMPNQESNKECMDNIAGYSSSDEEELNSGNTADKEEDSVGKIQGHFEKSEEERPFTPSFSSVMATWKAKDALTRLKTVESDH